MKNNLSDLPLNDWLSIQIPFRKEWVNGPKSQMYNKDPFDNKGNFSVSPHLLPVNKGAKRLELDETGRLVPEEIYCTWESIASDFSGMAIKVFPEGNQHQNWPYAVAKCSLPKLLQGHNVYGLCDIEKAFSNMIFLFSTAYPDLFSKWHERGPMLDIIDNVRLEALDLTKSIIVPNKQHRLALIDYMKSISKGQTKTQGEAYETTAYFGSKNSRLKKIKIYLKGPEVERENKDRKRRKKPLILDNEVKLAENMVRIESRLMREWFDRRRIPTNLKKLIKRIEQQPDLLNDCYKESISDLMKSMEGDAMTILNDDQVLQKLHCEYKEIRGKANRAFGVYQAIKGVGLDRYKKQLPRNTFYTHINMLKQAGFSHADLCNLHKPNNVIQIRTVINLDNLVNPVPDGHNPKNLWELTA